MAKLARLFETKEGVEVRVADMYFDVKSDFIYLIKRMDGRLVRFSTGVKRPNVRKAKEIANLKLRAQLNQANVVKLLVGDQFKIYLDESDKDVRRENLDPKTLMKRYQAWNQLKGFWQDKRVDEIIVDTWAEYVDYFETTYPGQSLFNARKYFANFARYLHHKQLNGRPVLLAVPALKNPFAARERKERKKKKSRILTAEEMSSIYKSCSPAEKILVLLMHTMALRIIEACSLRWESLDLDTGFYIFGEDDNKAGHEGRQAIHSEALAALKVRRLEVTSGFVFPQRDPEKHVAPQSIDWKSLKGRSGVNWAWSPHTFRHTCLTTLFSNPRHAHSSIMQAYRISYKVALEHYIHPDENALESLRNAIEVQI